MSSVTTAFNNFALQQTREKKKKVKIRTGQGLTYS